MNPVKLFLFALILVCFAFSACNKSDTNPTITGISLKINGTLQRSAAPVADYYKSQGTLQIAGNFSDTVGVSILITNAGVGTYDVAKDQIIATYSPDTYSNDTYLGATGTVTITALTSDMVSGSFSFIGTSPLFITGTVTEGKFISKITNL